MKPLSSIRSVGSGAFGLAAAAVLAIALLSADVLAQSNAAFIHDQQLHDAVIVVAGAQGRYGPYATMRRAQEVANQLRAQGYRTVAFHNGNGYWVDARP